MSSTFCQSWLFSDSPVAVLGHCPLTFKVQLSCIFTIIGCGCPFNDWRNPWGFHFVLAALRWLQKQTPWGFCSVWQSREGTEDFGFVKTCRKIHVLCLPLHVLHMCCHVSGPIIDTHCLRNSDIAFLQWKNLMSWSLLFSTKYQNPFFPVVTERQE